MLVFCNRAKYFDLFASFRDIVIICNCPLLVLIFTEFCIQLDFIIPFLKCISLMFFFVDNHFNFSLSNILYHTGQLFALNADMW